MRTTVSARHVVFLPSWRLAIPLLVQPHGLLFLLLFLSRSLRALLSASLFPQLLALLGALSPSLVLPLHTPQCPQNPTPGALVPSQAEPMRQSHGAGTQPQCHDGVPRTPWQRQVPEQHQHVHRMPINCDRNATNVPAERRSRASRTPQICN